MIVMNANNANKNKIEAFPYKGKPSSMAGMRRKVSFSQQEEEVSSLDRFLRHK